MARLGGAMAQLRQRAGAAWILMLVYLAGLLNAAGFLEYGLTLSHMTGNLSKLGLTVGVEEGAFFLFLLVLSFFIGATLSGYGFPTLHLAQWRRCGLVLVCAGSLLAISDGLPLSVGLHMALLSLVLGAQNGLNLRFQGVLTRTTHMTGHLTDCGAAFGRLLHQRTWRGADLQLFVFHLLCLVLFFLGVLSAAALYPWLPTVLPLSLLSLAGLLYLAVGACTMLYSLKKA